MGSNSLLGSCSLGKVNASSPKREEPCLPTARSGSPPSPKQMEQHLYYLAPGSHPREFSSCSPKSRGYFFLISGSLGHNIGSHSMIVDWVLRQKHFLGSPFKCCTLSHLSLGLSPLEDTPELHSCLEPPTLTWAHLLQNRHTAKSTSST